MNEVEMKSLEERASLMISQARIRMMQPSQQDYGFGGGKKNINPSFIFFSSLAMKLDPVVDWSIPTMATDSKKIFYNPSFTVSLTPTECLAVIVHEVLHVALLHMVRTDTRDHAKSNTAQDLVINSMLDEQNLILPPFVLRVGKPPFEDFPPGLCWEQYYDMLKDEHMEKVAGAPTMMVGGVIPLTEAEAEEAKAKWEVAVAQARAQARSIGKLAGSLGRMVDEVIDPPQDWRALLREFVSTTAKNEYNWSRPNRRYIEAGLYLPGLHSEELGHVVVAIDTSGSVGARELGEFQNELNGILGAYTCEATIIYCDAAVNLVSHWRSEDGPIKLTPCGGGGTSHVPVFEAIAKLGFEPACVIALTDLCTVFPSWKPQVDVLWAVTGGATHKPPFGRVIHVR